jgi:ribosomal-protein-alanine N-acetyltransferase
MRPPREIATERLLLRAPRQEDAKLVYERYASDADVTRYVAFPRHRSVEDAGVFIAMALEEWGKDNPMAYLAFSSIDGHLVGSTGLIVETPERGSTGYVLARDAWGRGFATEMARAMVDLAFDRMGLRRRSPGSWGN